MSKPKIFQLTITGETVNGEFPVRGVKKLNSILRNIKKNFSNNKITICELTK